MFYIVFDFMMAVIMFLFGMWFYKSEGKVKGECFRNPPNRQLDYIIIRYEFEIKKKEGDSMDSQSTEESYDTQHCNKYLTSCQIIKENNKCLNR